MLCRLFALGCVRLKVPIFQKQEDFPETLQTKGDEIFPRTSCESVATATKTHKCKYFLNYDYHCVNNFNDEFLCVHYIHKSLNLIKKKAISLANSIWLANIS